MCIIKLKLLPVPVIVFSPRFAISKNVVHSLEPGETPSNGYGAVANNFSIYLCSVM